MSKMIFINLPVTDLAASRRFYEALGFVQNPHFSDATTASMVWSETITVMLHTHDKWHSFTQRPIPPAGAGEVMLAISCNARDDVERMTGAATTHGGTADINPPRDFGFMYNRSFLDPDGHLWEAVWMDPAAVPT